MRWKNAGLNRRVATGAVDYRGEIYAIAKWASVKTKQVKDRLGDENALPSVEEAKKQIAQDMLPVMKRLNDKLDSEQQERQSHFEKRRQELVAKQRAERRSLNNRLEQRQNKEQEIRQHRFRTGFKGLWDRFSGEHGRVKKLNEREIYESFVRDRAEKEGLIFRHLDQRRNLNAYRVQTRQDFRTQKEELKQDVQAYKGMLSEQREQRLEDYSRERKVRNDSKEPQNRNRGRSYDR